VVATTCLPKAAATGCGGRSNDLITGDSDVASHDDEDTIYGQDGDDVMGGFGRSDRYYGGDGFDEVTFDGGIDVVAANCEILSPQ
jgi:Ca2+-binding RTX toxin-like protein